MSILYKMSFHNIKSCFLLLIITIIINLIDTQVPKTQYKYQNINSCKKSEFYDLNEFNCIACSVNNNNNLESTKDQLNCKCKSQTKEIVNYDNWIRAAICVQNCSELTNIKCATLQCSFLYVNVTEFNNQTSEKRIQIRNYHTNTQDCGECNLNWNTQYNEYCIYSALLQPYVKYSYYWQTTSPNFLHGQLKFVAFFCLELRNNTACQHLANLCVLSHYSSDKNSPCNAFLLAQNADNNNVHMSEMETRQLHNLRPLLYIPHGKQTALLLQQPLNVSARSLNKNEQLRFFSTTFSQQGNLIRLGEFKLAALDLCPTTSRKVLFAEPQLTKTCSLSLENLLDYAQQHANNIFMSIFLNYTISTSTSPQIMLQAVPVLIEGPEKQLKHHVATDWQLVTRFMLIEAHPRRISASQLKSRYEDEHKLLLYQSIRYIEHFELHYKIHAGNRMSVPYIKLRYRHVELRNNSTLQDAYPFSYAVTFSNANEDNSYNFMLQEILIPLLVLMAMGVAVLHTYAYKKRHVTELSVNCDCLFEFILQLASQTAHALLFYALLHLNLLAAKYYMQDALVIMPLHSDQLEQTFNTLIHIALLLKLIYCCAHFWRQSSYELYFIDWERPKVYNNNLFNLKCNLETSSVCSSARTLSSELNVSAWRMIHLANAWVRLSSKQQTSKLTQALLLVILNQFKSFDDFADNMQILRLFVVSMLYIMIFSLQQIWRIVIKENISKNPLQQLANICSACNISVLALLDQLSYGYYIHGRSPHGFADTDMCSLQLQMQKEPKLLRGLLSDSEQQHYIVVPPLNLRSYLARLLLPLQHTASMEQSRLRREINNIESNLERSCSSQGSMNRFLCAFIDHAIKDMDYIIKEKNILEKLCHYEYDHFLTDNKGTFYVDKSKAFGQLFLYGNDAHISILCLLILLAVYAQTSNLIYAIMAFLLFNMCLGYIFRYRTAENVAKKTLIDKQFSI